MAPFDNDFLLLCHCKYLITFSSNLTLNNVVTLRGHASPSLGANGIASRHSLRGNMAWVERPV